MAKSIDDYMAEAKAKASSNGDTRSWHAFTLGYTVAGYLSKASGRLSILIRREADGHNMAFAPSSVGVILTGSAPAAYTGRDASAKPAFVASILPLLASAQAKAKAKAAVNAALADVT